MTAADIYAAAERIRPLAKKTPVLTSSGFDSESGIATFFKCENFQKGGAFKIRGASNLVFSIPQTELARGVSPQLDCMLVKQENYIMIEVHSGLSMLFAGTTDPLAYLEL